jgi:hypothetical protein
MWEVTFYTHIKWNECLIYWWMTHSTASGTAHAVSHKIKASFLKTAPNPFSKVKFLFHKDTLIYWQAILDSVSFQLAKERYMWWPLTNMAKTNLIVYIFCATTVYLQYLIPTCPTMSIYSSNIFRASVYGLLHWVCCSFVCSLNVNVLITIRYE